MNTEAVWSALQALRQQDLPSHGGRTLAFVYDSGLEEADALGRRALASFASTNGLDPTAFPSLLRMEQDLISFAADLLDGPPSVVGSVTSGGTESILLAVQTARDSRPELPRPKMVLPTSAHAAFHKAAHYFRVEPIFVDVDPHTCRADPVAMQEAMTADTILVAASAPSYAHGVVDPVVEIATAAQARNIRCHVDAGIGGWLLPYLRRDDPELPAFSFLVPGVTSISVDLHKYAYTPKGVSILLHRDPDLRRTQLFASAAWPGYTMLNSTIQSTKSGGPLAAAWAVIRFIGDEGYARLARTVRDGVRQVVEGLSDLQGVHLLAHPDASLLAVATDGRCDAFTICDELLARGWYTQPQLRFGPFPPSVHLSLSASTRVTEFLDVFKASVKSATAAGPVSLSADLVSAIKRVDLRTLDDESSDALLQLVGLSSSGSVVLPDRMAPLNALLSVASGPVRQALLIGFLDRLTRPSR
jgi:sphinganine-1-phosphate aldolase